MYEGTSPFQSPEQGGQHDAGPTPSSAEHERAARIDQETARAQKEAADAQRSTAEVQRDIERDKLRQAKFAYKQAKRENRGQFLKLLYRVPKLVWLVLAVALIGGAVYASIVSTSSAPVETSFSSQLTKIVDVSRLATARFAYEGIAEKKNEKKETEYRVFYRAEVEASVEMSQIDFSNIDDETKTVYPVLPETSFKTTVDDDSFDFFEQNPAVNTKDVIKVCRKDATKEVTENSSIAAVALENLRDTVEALASPLLDSKGYTISWEEPPAKTEHTKNAKEQKHE